LTTWPSGDVDQALARSGQARLRQTFLATQNEIVSNETSWPVPFVIIRWDAVVRDGECAGRVNMLRTPDNNGRKILATTVMPTLGEEVISDPAWRVPFVLPTGDGGLEIATFTEFSRQDRHKHEKSIEIYTVLKGTLEIFIDDADPYAVRQGEEVVILPGTVHEILERRLLQPKAGEEFSLLVRVHAINCLGAADKFVQLSPTSPWVRWDRLSAEERVKAYRKHAVG